MMQNFITFIDGPIIPLRRSPSNSEMWEIRFLLLYDSPTRSPNFLPLSGLNRRGLILPPEMPFLFPSSFPILLTQSVIELAWIVGGWSVDIFRGIGFEFLLQFLLQLQTLTKNTKSRRGGWVARGGVEHTHSPLALDDKIPLERTNWSARSQWAARLS